MPAKKKATVIPKHGNNLFLNTCIFYHNVFFGHVCTHDEHLIKMTLSSWQLIENSYCKKQLTSSILAVVYRKSMATQSLHCVKSKKIVLTEKSIYIFPTLIISI